MMTSHTQRKDGIKEMGQEKENAYSDFFYTVTLSWTWGRLTVEERDRFTSAMKTRARDIKGSYLQRRNAYSACYEMFLEGLGYEPIGWREPEPKYEWVVSYEDGEELSRFETYEDALHQVKTMWEVDHVKAFITNEEVESPRF